MILWIKALFHQVKGLRNLAFIYKEMESDMLFGLHKAVGSDAS